MDARGRTSPAPPQETFRSITKGLFDTLVDMDKTLKLTKNDIAQLLDYIDNQWGVLTTTCDGTADTLIQLPNPYIKPSTDQGHFRFNEQYYWDSYFIALGLDDKQFVSGMLENLISLYREFKLIPNANRYYFTGRSQPPMLSSLVMHIYRKYGKSKEWLKDHIQIVMDEYETVWTSHNHPHARNVYKGLSRYYDVNNLHDLAEAESGWDMTTRFNRRCLDYLPVDLNCLLYKYETDIAEALVELNREKESKEWQDKAGHRKANINKLMWNEHKGLYFDYDFFNDKQSSVRSLAAYFALWAGVADHRQTEQLVNNLKHFEVDGGLTTTTKSVFPQSFYGSQKTQWAYPNGWAPLHVIVCDGLARYDYTEKAKIIANRWIKTCNDWYLNHNEILEKYNVEHPNLEPASGVYPTQHGFGWTNASIVYLADKYLAKA